RLRPQVPRDLQGLPPAAEAVELQRRPSHAAIAEGARRVMPGRNAPPGGHRPASLSKLAAARFMAIVPHTDAEREDAYDRQSRVGKLDKALDEANPSGWTGLDMKRGW